MPRSTLGLTQVAGKGRGRLACAKRFSQLMCAARQPSRHDRPQDHPHPRPLPSGAPRSATCHLGGQRRAGCLSVPTGPQCFNVPVPYAAAASAKSHEWKGRNLLSCPLPRKLMIMLCDSTAEGCLGVRDPYDVPACCSIRRRSRRSGKGVEELYCCPARNDSSMSNRYRYRIDTIDTESTSHRRLSG